jgi:large subunit ribosomal protein L25
MQRVEMNATVRDRAGKGVARGLRREGRVPAVLYSEGRSSLLSVNPVDVIRILRSASGENALITLKLSGETGGQARTAILRDYQTDPVSGELLHVDLFEISMDKPLRLKVPVEIKGDIPEGVKEGGVLEYHLRELEIECLPAMIPDRLDVVVAHMKIGESLHVKDLTIGSGIRLLHSPEEVVLSVMAPISEEKLTQMLTATPAETKEPEVLSKGKKEEEGAEAGAEAGAKPGAEAAPAAGEVKAKPGKEGPAAGGAKK